MTQNSVNNFNFFDYLRAVKLEREKRLLEKEAMLAREEEIRKENIEKAFQELKQLINLLIDKVDLKYSLETECNLYEPTDLREFNNYFRFNGKKFYPRDIFSDEINEISVGEFISAFIYIFKGVKENYFVDPEAENLIEEFSKYHVHLFDKLDTFKYSEIVRAETLSNFCIYDSVFTRLILDSLNEKFKDNDCFIEIEYFQSRMKYSIKGLDYEKTYKS